MTEKLAELFSEAPPAPVQQPRPAPASKSRPVRPASATLH
jgi:hypothetical protein